MFILEPKRTIIQPASPQLDRSNPVAAKLLHAVVPGVYQGDIGITGSALTGPPTAIAGLPYGRAAQYTSTNVAQLTIPGQTAYPFVMVWAGRLLSSAGNWRGVEVVRSGVSGDVHYIGLDSASAVRYATRNNFSATELLALSVPGGASTNTDIVIVAQSLSATDHRVYCRGAMATGATNTGTPAGAFNRLNLATSGNVNQWTYFAGFGVTALTDAEALELSSSVQNVNRLLQQPTQKIWVGSGGAATHTTTGGLASQSAAIAGTATHLTLHATSGALASQAAVIAGTATHLTLHATSGALAAQSAVIAGTATHDAAGSFDTTGSLASQSAVISGTAAHYTLHATSGALAAQAASISGTAQNGDGVEPSRNVGAGRSRKQRLRVVEIDGVDHVVSSEAEAQALIDKAKEAAEELAKLAVERAAKAQKRPARKVLADARKTLAPVEIKAPVDLQPLVDQALAEIQAIYKSAINTIEISTLLRKREAEEEDDDDVLLLL